MPDITALTSACGSMARDDQAVALSSGLEPHNGAEPPIRRRHSFFIPRRKSIIGHIMEGEEALLLQVDTFLSELERRLDFIESFSDLSKDSSISRAMSTLRAVRHRCSQASEDVIGEGRRRVHLMVETLEARYQETLEAAGSLNEKARVGVDLLDEMLTDFEARAYKIRDRSLANAATAAEAFMDEGRRVASESIERARRAAFSLEEHIQQAIKKAKERKLLKYDDLPLPWRANPHIKQGYRFAETKLECIRSMFNLSNEFINIWSHALGLIVVLAIALYFYPTSNNFSLSKKSDVFVAAVFFVMACLTLVCSTIWHTMSAVADVYAMTTFACVDYTGISLLIAASIVTTEYTAFYCDPVSQIIHISLTVLLGVGGTILPWHPYFNVADKSWMRVAFYVGLALTGFMPLVQLSITHGPVYVYNFYSPITMSLLVYLGGAIIYATKVPERWWPGMFDYIGWSHNLWHAAVLGGILFHYAAMQKFFASAFRLAEDGCPVY